MYSQPLRQSDERADSDIAFAALDETDKIAMHVGQLGQLFLTEATILTQGADALAQDHKIFVAHHTQCVAPIAKKLYTQSVSIQLVFIQCVLMSPCRMW